MAGKAKPKIHEKDLQGFKHFRLLLPALERLHTSGCACDKAGNRKLHFDEYCALILLFMFNPIVSSLRAIQQASELMVQIKQQMGGIQFIMISVWQTSS